jgi:hypothetical protein
MRSRSSTAREKLYDASRVRNAAGALEEYPRCNIPGCGAFVLPGQRWVESHYPVMKTNGGTVTGVAHQRCNFLFWCEVEAPQLARMKKARRRHIGARVPRGRPLPGGRDDPRKRTIAGPVVERATGKPWKGWKRRTRS